MRASYIASAFMAALVVANEFHGRGVTVRDALGIDKLWVSDLDYEFQSAEKWIYVT